MFLSYPRADGGRNIVGTKHGRLPWGTVVARSVSAWSLAQPVNRLWSGSAMYNSIMQPFHGQRTPTVLIQIPPKGQTQSKHSAEVEVFILLNCLSDLKRMRHFTVKVTQKMRKVKPKRKVWLWVFIREQIISLQPIVSPVAVHCLVRPLSSRYLSGQTLRLSAPGFGLNDHYPRTWIDRSSVGQIPLPLWIYPLHNMC